MPISDSYITVFLGEEEKEYWKKVAKERKKNKGKGKRGASSDCSCCHYKYWTCI